jgi:hypothetical protein
MKYDANTKRKVHAALEAALDRMRLLRRKPSYWEADCLSVQGRYGNLSGEIRIGSEQDQLQSLATAGWLAATRQCERCIARGIARQPCRTW